MWFCPLLCVCREIRNVELLKLRFGESHMHYCEVMLKVNTVGFCHPHALMLSNYQIENVNKTG